jgi:catechol 2,3-dioxygenase-like lactoylglutathione lyase family enzyme
LVFLASDAASYVSGVSIIVDAGFVTGQFTPARPYAVQERPGARRRSLRRSLMVMQLDTMATYAVEYGLHVTDAEASLRFYRDVLGFKPYAEIYFPGGHVWGLRFGNSMIKLLQDEVPPTTKNPRERSIGFRYITIHVLNAEEIVQRCRDEGYEVMTPVSRFTSSRPGDPECYYAFVRDPDGNTVEFSQGSPWIAPTDEFLRGKRPLSPSPKE